MPKAVQETTSRVPTEVGAWAYATIGDICEMQTTRSNPQDLPEDTPYLGLTHIESQTFRILGFGTVKEVSSSVTPFQIDDVLFGKLRPYLRKVTLAPSRGVCTPEILVLRPDLSKVLPVVLHGIVSNPSVIQKCVALSAGTRMPRTKPKDLQSIPVRLPPLELQGRIGDLIGSVDAYISNLRVRAEAARSARSALLHDLLAPDRAVLGWRETTLGEIAQVVSGGTPKTKVPEYWGGDIVWVIPSEVVAQEGGVIKQSERMITQAGLTSSSAKMLPKGAVLLTSRATIGAVALAGVPLCTNQGFASLVPSEAVMSHFLMYWCQTNTHEFILRSGGNTFKEVSRKKVARIPIALPPLSEQRKIVCLIKSVDTHIGALRTCVDVASGLRTGLLSDLLSGRHQIPASYDRFLSAE